jgi:hypothetical protein
MRMDAIMSPRLQRTQRRARATVVRLARALSKGKSDTSGSAIIMNPTHKKAPDIPGLFLNLASQISTWRRPVRSN